jgi:hypothetical protein
VQAGIAAAHAAGVPMMLVGPQFTLNTPDPVRYERFVKMVDDIGAADHVPVLSRYALMKSWSAKGAKALSLLLSGDGLHMSDLGYRCLRTRSPGRSKAQPSEALVVRRFLKDSWRCDGAFGGRGDLGRRLRRDEFRRLLRTHDQSIAADAGGGAPDLGVISGTPPASMATGSANR